MKSRYYKQTISKFISPYQQMLRILINIDFWVYPIMNCISVLFFELFIRVWGILCSSLGPETGFRDIYFVIISVPEDIFWVNWHELSGSARRLDILKMYEVREPVLQEI